MSDFPAMIFHGVHGNKIVNSEHEMKQHIENGWSKIPVIKVDELKQKLEFYKKEVTKIEKELSKYEVEKEPEKISEEESNTKSEELKDGPKYRRRFNN